MAEEDDLSDEASHYMSEKKYPDGASATRKIIISKRVEKIIIVDGELYYKPSSNREVDIKWQIFIK